MNGKNDYVLNFIFIYVNLPLVIEFDLYSPEMI